MMSTVRGCPFPDDLYYDVESNVWCRREPDGSVTVGMTAYATALAGPIVAFTPKAVGRRVEQERSVATVESGKWVGPVKAPVSGEIIAVNEALDAQPGLVNEDPYGAGWMVRMQPSEWDEEVGTLLTGEAALNAFEVKMEAEGFAGCA
ncbi:MAG: glycine cleavage system protein GcvH [Burkholderiales bacterium]